MVDIEETLRVLENNGLFRLGRRSGDWFQIYCPVHSDGNESHPSCGVLLYDKYSNGEMTPAGLCHCFACGMSKMLPEVVGIALGHKGIHQEGSAWLKENAKQFGWDDSGSYSSELLIPDNIRIGINNQIALEKMRAKMLEQKQTYVSEEELQTYRFTVPYMYERKLTDKSIEEYDIGFDAQFVPYGRKKPVPCITFPVRDSKSRTLYIVRRSIEGKFYFIPDNVPKVLYGIDLIPQGCTEIMVCESFINAITAHQYGFNTVALMGTGSQEQYKQLRSLGVRRFVVALDPDDAGIRGTKRLRKALSDVALIYDMTSRLPEGKDINDCEEWEVRQAYQEAVTPMSRVEWP